MSNRVYENQILFFIAYTLFVLLQLVRTSFFLQYVPDSIYYLILVTCAGLLAINEIIAGKGTVRTIISLIVCGIYVALVIYIGVTFYMILAITVLFVYEARDISFRKLAAYSAWLCFIFLAITIISSQVGIITDYIRSESSRAPRHFLGFRYALYPATIIMNITMITVYVRKKSILWLELIILTGINFWIFKMTGARLSFFISLFILAAAAFLKLKPYFFVKKTRFRKILSAAFVICALLSLIVSVRYNPEQSWQKSANSMLSDRLALQNTAMEEYGFSIFGQDIHENGYGLKADGSENEQLEDQEYFYIDNFYILCYTKYGIVFFVVMLVFMTALAYGCAKYDKYGYLSIIMCMLAVHCVIQDTFLSLHYNSFLLIAGNLMINKLGHRTETDFVESDDAAGRVRLYLRR